MAEPAVSIRERGHDGVVDPSVWTRCASQWLLPLAATLLSIPVLTGVVGGLKLMVGLPISGIEVVLAVLVTMVGLAVWLVRVHGPKWWVGWVSIIGAVAMVILPSAVLGERVLDDTWDGQWFHQEAVIQLADGWNPFRADLDPADVPREGARIRINGYAKATWLWGAPLYSFTGRIETAKAFSFPLAVAAGLSVLACLLLITPLRPLTATVVAVAAAANPVAVVQFLNTYQDGALASMLTICAASLALWVRTGSRIGLAMATAAGVGASAIKLTGPVYVIIFVVAAVGWLVWNGKWRHQWRALAIAVGLATIGLHAASGGTYLTNTVRHGHPLFPVFGPEKAPIVETSPHHRLQVMAASIFSRSRPGPEDYGSVESLIRWRGLKIPFVFDGGELSAFMRPWVRIGGWGPLFGGVVLLTAVLLVVSAFRRHSRVGLILLVAAPLAISVVVNPVCWKARYVPQSWLVPLVIAVVVLATSKGRLERLLVGAILVTACANSLLVAWGHVPAVVHNSNRLRTHLLDLDEGRRPINVDFGPFRANRVRLAELGIDFSEVEDDHCSLAVYNGFASAKVIRSEVEEASDGERLVSLQWKPTPGARSYRVGIVDHPAGELNVEGAEPPHIETSGPEAVVLVGPHRTTLTLEICNDLGCCPPKVLRVVEALE